MPPYEWLLELSAKADGYRALLRESGSLARAAHRIATARCTVSVVSSSVPTAREVRAAAIEIIERGGVELPVPDRKALAFDCERLGLLVI